MHRQLPDPNQDFVPTAILTGDVNGDGDLDLVETSFGQGTPIVLGEGNGIFRTSLQTLPTTDSTYRAALADVDGDGDLDLYLLNSGQDSLYLNLGSGVFVDATSNLPPDTSSNQPFFFTDVEGDGDGDLDLVFWGDGVPLRQYRNDGTGVFTDASANMPQTPIATVQDATLADVDGDGDDDVFVALSASNGKHNKLYFNDGNGVYAEGFNRQPPNLRNTYHAIFVDVDDDGDPDLVMEDEDVPASLFRYG